MEIGPFVRHRLGALEVPMANLYRSAFINLRSLAGHLAETVTPVKRILEVGCGDGALATELVKVYPDADYVGIDVAPTAGRLYRGDPDRATFRTVTVQEFATEGHEQFDLVVVVDVVHHVLRELREEVLACSEELVKPGGHLAIKEFERRGLYYALTYAADRYLTGDKNVSFLDLRELRALFGNIDGIGPLTEWRVPPASNNVLFVGARTAE